MGTVTIPLTKNKIARVDEVDSDLAALNWYAFKAHGIFYAIRELQVSLSGEKRRRRIEQMHRVILSRKLDRSLLPTELVDHKDGDGLNNTRSNLRLATNGQNLANRRGPTRQSQSGVLGVCWDKSKQRWLVQISKDGKRVFMKRFITLREAQDAHRQASLEIFGEFSPYNRESFS
jgi:hypothetical protein